MMYIRPVNLYFLADSATFSRTIFIADGLYIRRAIKIMTLFTLSVVAGTSVKNLELYNAVDYLSK